MLACRCGHAIEEHDAIPGYDDVGGACASCECDEYEEDYDN